MTAIQDRNPLSDYAITVDDIRAAAVRIEEHVVRTPVTVSERINEAVGAELFFKCENLQHGGAFKARGACNAVFSLSTAAAAAGVVAHSSGNHAAALARAARRRGIAAHIVMPHNSAAVKIAAVRELGVEPTFCEPDAESRQAVADRVMTETGATFIHPFNDARVMAGQGTAMVELLEQIRDLDAVVVPVGGGGLLSGTLIAARALRPTLKVFAAEPEWADDAFRSLHSGRIEAPIRYDSIADGLRTPLGTLTFPIIRDLVEDVLLAGEDAIRTATASLIRNARVLVEPSGAVSLAAITRHASRFQGMRVGVMISGGNLNSDVLVELLHSSNTKLLTG